MTNACKRIIDLLEDDEVSHSWVVYAYHNFLANTPLHSDVLGELLTEILNTGNVEIGVPVTLQGRPGFVAWRGSVADRVTRALVAVTSTSEPEQDYVYWLILAEHVTRFEDE